MTKQLDNKLQDSIHESDVVDYLKQTPDFFIRHADLLADLTLPHESGDAISLVERQVAVLREQRDKAREQMQTLISNARKNEQLNNHIDALILALLDADDLQAVIDLVRARLASDMDADIVVVRLFDTGHATFRNQPELVDWSEPVMGAFEKVIAGRRPVCGSLKPGQLDALFNDASEEIKSAALIPLVADDSSKRCLGLLAIGSTDSSRFRASMGTVFLSQLGKVLTRIIKMKLE